MAPGKEKHDAAYYFKCMVGGILACGLTHTGIVTVDLIKCRKQVAKDLYPSIIGGIKKVRAEEGLKGMVLVLFF